tara:strand:- start:1621 stop:2265 length:645 start_codon:yes stop_codon:yes gene_type:complete
MFDKLELPNKVPVFPLSNFIFFPKTTVPLNIFEPRYIQMINDSIKSNRFIGMIQPKKTGQLKKPDLYDIGCLGKITSFNETEDGRYIVVLSGLIRFKIKNEIENQKKYRECEISYEDFKNDLEDNNEPIKFTDLELIFNNFKKLFDNQGYLINWKEFEKQDLNETINTLAMASPFTLEEKQMLLETKNINYRKEKLEQIINTYVKDQFSNKTIQ